MIAFNNEIRLGCKEEVSRAVKRARKCLTPETAVGTITVLNARISISRMRPARPAGHWFP